MSPTLFLSVSIRRRTRRRVVADINRYRSKHFFAAVEGGDLKSAALWQANTGRSLSLGDFSLVNVARAELPSSIAADGLERTLVRALVNVQGDVRALAPEPDKVLFVCSGAKDEVAYVWAAPNVP